MRALAALTALAAVVASAGLVVGHGSSATAAVEPCQPGDVAVEIRNFAYSPAAVVVPPGATICWTNRDTAPHTVTSSSAGGFDSGTIGNEQSFRLQFSSEGTFGYLCTFHAYMTGQVVVSANPQPPPPPLPPPPGPPPPAPPPPPQPPTPPAAKALTVSRFGVRVERKSGARWLVVRASPNRAVAGRLSLMRGRRTALRADRRLRAGANVVRVRLPRGLAHGRYLCVLRAGAVRRTASLHL